MKKTRTFIITSGVTRGYSPHWCSGWPPLHQCSACNYVNSGCRGEGSHTACYCFVGKSFLFSQNGIMAELVFGLVYCGGKRNNLIGL